MTKRLDVQTLVTHADLVLAPVEQRLWEDRNFGLPREIHLATVGLFLAYLTVMAFGIRSHELVIPMAINFILVVAAFGVPTLWTTMRPRNSSAPDDLDRFIAEGFDCHTGHLSAGSATIQVLIMPVLLMLWGIAVVVIVKLV